MDGSFSGIDALQARFDAQKQAFSFGSVPSVDERREAMDRLVRLLRTYQEKIAEAISQDFGTRSETESLQAEVALSIECCQSLRKNLPKWAGDRKFFRPLGSVPGKSYVQRVPKGVVGVIAPWNYPFQLALVPVATALAAGNRVMLKPSEATPATSELLREFFAEGFGEDEVAVATGGPEVGKAFSELPFDHLFYTGSTEIGRMVAVAAAKNLTPVTLELGGKSPTVMMPDATPEKHAHLVALGKLYNAGQTCTAPDYLMVPRGMAGAYADAILRRAAEFYDDPARDADYTAIVSERHRARLAGLVEDAERGGASVRRAEGGDYAGAGKMAPTVVLNPSPDAKIMQEEIFGPVLPIIEYDGVGDAIAFITDRPHPLALYVFGDDEAACRDVLARTTSGGAMINGTVFHVAAEHLPFGGVGASGQGAYHGEAGYAEFSHDRSVLIFPQADWLKRVISPPYGKLMAFNVKRQIGKN